MTTGMYITGVMFRFLSALGPTYEEVERYLSSYEGQILDSLSHDCPVAKLLQANFPLEDAPSCFVGLQRDGKYVVYARVLKVNPLPDEDKYSYESFLVPPLIQQYIENYDNKYFEGA